MLLCAGWASLVWLHTTFPGNPLTGPMLEELLLGASVAMALTAGVLCLLRWRLTGEAPLLAIGSAMVLFGTITTGLAGLLPVLGGSGATAAGLTWSRPASMIVVLCLLAYALTAPAVDAALRPRALLLPALAMIAALTMLLRTPPFSGTSGGATPPVATALLGLGLLGVAGAYWITGIRWGRRLHLWMALALLGLGLCELMRAMSPPTGDDPAPVGLLCVAALTLAVVGAIRELQWAYAEQSGRLLHSMATTQQVEERMRAQEEAQQERAHDARNALSAIEGATITLERYRDSLDQAARISLESAISEEIARLQRLIAPHPSRDDPAPFDLAQTLTPLITVERLAGTRVDSEITDGIVAWGRQADIAEIVQNLLVNARRYAPGSPVLLGASCRGPDILLAVEDRGPGVAPHQREAIFARGARGDRSLGVPGSGLGLFISAQLARAQGGELWVEERPGGGASFKLRLRSAEGSADGGGTAEGRQHAVEGRSDLSKPTNLKRLLSGLRPRRWGTVARPIAQPDDDLGTEISGKRA